MTKKPPKAPATKSDGLTPKQAEIVKLRLKGLSLRQIEKKTGIDHASVGRTLQIEKVKRRVDEAVAMRVSEVSDTLKTRAARYIDKLNDIALGKVKGTPHQVNTLQDLVDRAGIVVTQKHEVSTNINGATDEELEQRLAKLRASNGKVK